MVRRAGGISTPSGAMGHEDKVVAFPGRQLSFDEFMAATRGGGPTAAAVNRCASGDPPRQEKLAVIRPEALPLMPRSTPVRKRMELLRRRVRSAGVGLEKRK